MEDTSLLPQWDPSQVIKNIGDNKIDQKAMKLKLDRFYMIGSYNQQEYLPDVIQVYGWIKLATQYPLSTLLVSDRAQKYFLEQFISMAIKDMILCKKFKHKIMMVLTQQMMVQALKIFIKYYQSLQKYPKMTTMLKYIFDNQKQFYRLNYVNDHYYLILQPSSEQIYQTDKFIESLKSTDRVDILKSELHSKRMCWLSGTVKKITNINVYVNIDYQKQSSTFDRKSMQVAPYGTHKNQYQWRYNIAIGQKVDFQTTQGHWKQAVVMEIRKVPNQENQYFSTFQIELSYKDDQQWISITDPRMQKSGTILAPQQQLSYHHSSELYLDDYNDLLFDSNMTSIAIVRPQTVKSQLYIDLMMYAHKQLNLYELIATSISQRKFGIQVTAQLINYIYLVYNLFHRKFAMTYLNKLTNSILEYIQNLDQQTIRNFSKQRYDIIYTSLNDFMKRLKPATQRKLIVQKFQLKLILRFLYSDFLDRKLQAVTMLTSFLKLTKHSITLFSPKQFDIWIRQNKIIHAIYNQKSHSQLINRSTDFMTYLLVSKPSIQDLEPLLQWNQSIIKLVSQLFQYFPTQFQNQIVNKIKQKQKVQNKDALNIIKKTNGCQNWLLKNGGQGWVQVVKDKSKRRTDIAQVFQQDFSIVMKITKQIADLYQCKFKNQYFLYCNQINYLPKLLNQENIDIKLKLDFANLTLDSLNKVNDDVFKAILPLTRQVNDSLPTQYQDFFVSLLPKLSKKHMKQLFETNFSKTQNLENMGQGQFNLFKKCFLALNQQAGNLDRKTVFRYAITHPYKKQKQSHFEINANPNQLIGMNQLLHIIFQNKLISVTQRALKLIGFLFDYLTPSLADSAVLFKRNFLDTCLQKFYTTQNKQQKYLKIIQKVMNQSQKQGCDKQPSVSALFPVQNITVRLIDHFNVNRNRMLLTVPSNLTLYQLRGEIGRAINAYIHQIKILMNGKQLDARLNGQVIHTLQFTDDFILQKKGSIQKVSLTDNEGALTQKAKSVFKNIFKQYSTCGYMSKQQCQKYHQRCVGQVTSSSQARVQKIYQQYDKDKDGCLTQEDFLKFYQNAVRTRQSAVWQNLQTFGVRNDLENLSNLEFKYPDPTLLTRNLLYNNQKFMNHMFQLLGSQDQKISSAAWAIARRLPLTKNMDIQFNHQRKYSFRYWLYLVQACQQYDKVNQTLLKKILHSDLETICIGLKVSHSCVQFDKQIFHQLMNNLGKINQAEKLDFHNKVILNQSLKLIQDCLRVNPILRQQYLNNLEEYDQIFSSGLKSSNSQVRMMYCQCISSIMDQSTQQQWPLYQALFGLVYRNFEKADKSTLHIEYFDLFSQLLENLRQNSHLLQKLKLNWTILTTSIIKQYQTHRCRQQNMNSPPDQVAQGFLRIVTKLLDTDTLQQFTPLVPYIFKHNLFPQTGLNKLKNSKSRKDAYELIYQICRLKDKNEQKIGLIELFNAGFKEVYKKMSQNKTTYTFSYYYSYNQARSELGYAGIRNLGCICYMISMLQQLYMTSSFRYLALMAEDGQPQCLVKKGSKQIDDNIFHQLQTLFANLELTQRQQYNPDQFCFTFKDFQGNPVNVSVQQDAQQFLNIFFDKLQTSLKNSSFKHIFEGIFGGKSCSRTICSNCKAVKQRQQNFYPLSLQIKGYKDIYDSLKKYIQGQIISDYQCDFCNKKTDVTKSCYLSKVPDNFIIHLQRMCFNYQKFENQKVNSRWEFPHLLDIYDYTVAKLNNLPHRQTQYQFRLKGIVVHYGSADFGHYYSYIRQSDNKWIQFNDQRIRQFDPRDIQLECFGGEHWRRQHQNAYLLVYQRLQQSDIMLEFDTEEQKTQILSKYKLIEKPRQCLKIKQQRSPERQKQTIIQTQTQQKTQNQSQSPSQNQPKQQKKIQKKKITAYIDPLKIVPYIPQKLSTKINKANQQFSFSINLSNDQFAYFVYKILSIDPPQQLTAQYLQLSYQCFHLKQVIDQTQGLTLSQWAAKRFKQLIAGHGWEFLKNFGQNWQSDILSIQRSTRIGMRNLLDCVITDIICSNNLNNQQNQTSLQTQQQQSKRKIVLGFLDKYSDMMNDQVAKHWPRFKQYFDVWLTLIQQNHFVRRYCQQKMFIQKILDFVMEEDSLLSKTYKRHSMGNQYYSAQFQHPLNVMTLLIKNGYQLNDFQNKCMNTYAFMNKIITFPTQHFSLIQHLCKDNHSISQKMAFLILFNCSKVTQSDYVKSIIVAIHCFLGINDAIQKKRVQWIVGFPQYIQHQRTTSYGVYGISPQHDYIVQYISPVGTQPILQQLLRFKTKAHHVAALLVSMLLQLQSDGHIRNLDQFPAAFAFHLNYTHWFAQFVQGYYEDTHQSYTAPNYKQYGSRLKTLFVSRPGRPKQYQFNYLIGKTLQKQVISQQSVGKIFDICQVNIQSALIPISPQKPPLSTKIIKKLANSQNFLPKPSASYALSTFMPINRLRHSSDDQQVITQQNSNPFDKAFSATIFRKIVLKNNSLENMLAVMVLKGDQESNLVLPVSQLSCDIRAQSLYCVSLIKKDIQKDFGNLHIQIKILGKSTRSGYWPRQIITEIQQKQDDDKVSSDEDSSEHWK